MLYPLSYRGRATPRAAEPGAVPCRAQLNGSPDGAAIGRPGIVGLRAIGAARRAAGGQPGSRSAGELERERQAVQRVRAGVVGLSGRKLRD